VEHLVKAVAVNQLGGATEKLDRCLFAKCANRTQHRHALRCFQGQTGRHDFAPDSAHVLIFQRTWVVGLDFFQYLRYAVGAEKRRTFGPLDIAHTFSQMSPLVQEGE
jgi:hypothetical protein